MAYWVARCVCSCPSETASLMRWLCGLCLLCTSSVISWSCLTNLRRSEKRQQVAFCQPCSLTQAAGRGPPPAPVFGTERVQGVRHKYPGGDERSVSGDVGVSISRMISKDAASIQSKTPKRSVPCCGSSTGDCQQQTLNSDSKRKAITSLILMLFYGSPI